ncbi:hypothetical protein C8034_v005582 [Colletotrichum sidae]|uniref:Uncharacterized protein n=1 Tax=Colletotrichum sidae TaxID=1347389 RepID=A0A4R8T751_9PEZI|nr:hypothetical protein C8034_v005582 [Colletotrichum sidae]
MAEIAEPRRVGQRAVASPSHRLVKRPSGPSRFQCKDYKCAASKHVQTTPTANCNTVCFQNCEFMVSGAPRNRIKDCSYLNKDFLSSQGSFVLDSYFDANCNCKYCVCKCAYDIDNIDRFSLPSCGSVLLCKIVAVNSAWTYVSAYTPPEYSCRL